jgi:hypothetical protein
MEAVTTERAALCATARDRGIDEPESTANLHTFLARPYWPGIVAFDDTKYNRRLPLSERQRLFKIHFQALFAAVQKVARRPVVYQHKGRIVLLPAGLRVDNHVLHTGAYQDLLAKQHGFVAVDSGDFV